MNDIINLPPLEHLRSLVAFVEAENIIKASVELKISQPLLSQRLKALEVEVGQPLFEYRGRKKVLTAFGQEVYETVKRQLENLSSEMRQTLLSKAKLKSLRIGGRKEILDTLAPRLDFDGSIDYRPMGGAEVERALHHRSIDIGISQRDIDSSVLVRKKCFSDEFVLCASSKIRMSGPADLKKTLETLSEHRLFQYGQSGAQDASEISSRLLEHFGFNRESRLITTYPDWHVIMTLLEAKAGWAIAPLSYAKVSQGVKVLPLPAALQQTVQFYVYYPKGFSKLDWFAGFIKQF